MMRHVRAELFDFSEEEDPDEFWEFRTGTFLHCGFQSGIEVTRRYRIIHLTFSEPERFQNCLYVGMPFELLCDFGVVAQGAVTSVVSTLNCRSMYYEIAAGQMRGAHVSMLGWADDKQSVAAILSSKDWITPPIVLPVGQLKRNPWGPLGCLPFWQRVVLLLLVAVSLYSMVTHDYIAISLAGTGLLWAMLTAWWLGRRGKEQRTCPSCGNELDLMTHSRCDLCEWTRPLPAICDAQPAVIPRGLPQVRLDDAKGGVQRPLQDHPE